MKSGLHSRYASTLPNRFVYLMRNISAFLLLLQTPNPFPEELTSLSCDVTCTVIYNAKCPIIKQIAILLKILQLM